MHALGAVVRAGAHLADYRFSHVQKGADYDRDLARGDFNTYMTRHEARLLRRLVPRLFAGLVPRHLDFACGTGRITSVLEPLARRSYGVDVSTRMIARARAKCPRAVFLVADLTLAPLPFEQFQLISLFRFLGNAEPELRRAALRTLHDLLDKDGFLIVNNHKNPWAARSLLGRLIGRPGSGDLGYARLRQLLAETGFSIVQTFGIGLWIAATRLDQPAVLESPFADVLEPVSNLSFLRYLCPDVIVVARRAG